MGVIVEGMRYIIMHGAEIQGRCGRETEPQYSVHAIHQDPGFFTGSLSPEGASEKQGGGISKPSHLDCSIIADCCGSAHRRA